MEDYIYKNIEIDDNCPRYIQPGKIKIELKPHQLAGLYKAINMEKKGNTNYLLNSNEINISTNLGILGDTIGYGKTILALSIVASNSLNNIYINDNIINSYSNIKKYSHLTITTKNKNLNNKILKTTLIIVPRGPVYVQWENCLKNYTNLKYLPVDNLHYIKNNLPIYNGENEEEIENFFNGYDVLLIKNTTFKILMEHYIQCHIIKKWKRIIIDEAHDIITKIPMLNYDFLWLISGTYNELYKKTLNTHNIILYSIKDFFINDNIDYLLIKSCINFVKSSFTIPQPIEKYYICKLSKEYQIIKDYISQSVLEKINANDFQGAIKELGGKNETETNIIELITKELKKEISNKEREREYIEQIDILQETKMQKIKNIDNELIILKNKLEDIIKRIQQIKKQCCSICMDNYDNPVLLECTHTYCFKCIFEWFNEKKNTTCPICRKNINMNNLISLVDNSTSNIIINETDKNKEEDIIRSKEDTLLNIIKQKTEGKFLVFSKNDNGFNKICKKLKENNIYYDMLKGTTTQMMSILNKLKNNEIKVILLNTQYAGCGIDINFATDVIIFHSMGLDKYQAIGRAQRVGRKEQLYIHNLCYDHEINN